MITPAELDIFQQCRAKWQLARQAGPIGETYSDYTTAIRKTIFQMYGWLQEKDRLMNSRQVRERWDKNWWAAATEESTLDRKEILEKAADGWILLEKIWGELYLEQATLVPIGINFEFSTYIRNLHYRVHTDVILADKNGLVTYIEFGGSKTEWQLYTSLGTKLELVGLTNTLNVVPHKRLNIDIISRKHSYIQKQLNISEDFIRNAHSIMDSVSAGIKQDAIYVSPTVSCYNCDYAGKCWF